MSKRGVPRTLLETTFPNTPHLSLSEVPQGQKGPLSSHAWRFWGWTWPPQGLPERFSVSDKLKALARPVGEVWDGELFPERRVSLCYEQDFCYLRG